MANQFRTKIRRPRAWHCHAVRSERLEAVALTAAPRAKKDSPTRPTFTAGIAFRRAVTIVAVIATAASVMNVVWTAGYASEPTPEPEMVSGRTSPAATVDVTYSCGFEPADDRDYNGWPDNWSRTRGHDFPTWVRIEIERPDDAAFGGQSGVGGTVENSGGMVDGTSEASPGRVAGSATTGESGNAPTILAPAMTAKTSTSSDRPNGNVLAVHVNGGSVWVRSPIVPILPAQTYQLLAWVRSAGLVHDECFVSIEQLSAEGKRTGAIRRSAGVTITSGWTLLLLDDIETESTQVAGARIGLHVAPKGADTGDLSGRVEFDGLRLARKSRLELRTEGGRHFFRHDERIGVTCEISSLTAARSFVDLEARDEDGNVLYQARRETLQTTAVLPDTRIGPAGRRANSKAMNDLGTTDAAMAEPAVRRAEQVMTSLANWTIPGLPPGRYVLTAQIHNLSVNEPSGEPWSTIRRRIVVWDAKSTRPSGTFGWSLTASPPLADEDRDELFSRVGIGWIKFPVIGFGESNKTSGADGGIRQNGGMGQSSAPEGATFFNASDGTSESVRSSGLDTRPAASSAPAGPVSATSAGITHEGMAFAAQLRQRGFRVFGVIDRFPDAAGTMPDWPLPALTFLAKPYAESVILARLSPLSLHVHGWQFGGDDDNSLTDDPKFSRHVSVARRLLSLMGQIDSPLVVFDALAPTPKADQAELARRVLTSSAPLTHLELRQLLTDLTTASAPSSTSTKPVKPAGSPDERLRPMVMLKPLDQADYAYADRAADLVLRMAETRRQGPFEAGLVDPFDPRWGLFTAEGEPDQMLPVWRTAANLLGNADEIGQLILPGGSHNVLFADRNAVDQNEAMLLLWSDQPATETIQLGDTVRVFDVAGRPVKVTVDAEGHHLPVGPVPVYVLGCDRPLALFQANFRFEQTRLESLPGTSQTLDLTCVNPFPQPATATINLTAGDLWRSGSQRLDLRFSPGKTAHEALDVQLAGIAAAGTQDLLVEVELQADRLYKFRMHREIEVGLEGLKIELRSFVDADNRLVIEQRFVNSSEGLLRFRCHLFAPARKRQRVQVIDLPPGEQTNRYMLAEGAELVGQDVLVRAEEIGGSRVLNVRHTISAEEKN